MNTSFETNKIKYLDLTHKLNDYNEIYNVNSYIQENNNMELDRLNSSNNTIKTRILRMKQEYLLNDQSIKEFNFRKNILYFTIVIICIILSIVALYVQDKINIKLTMIACGSISIIYLFILMFVINANVNRRSYAYNQYYWNQIQKQI